MRPCGAKGKCGPYDGNALRACDLAPGDCASIVPTNSLRGRFIWQKTIPASRHSAMCASWLRSRTRRVQWRSPPHASKMASREGLCPYLNRCTQAVAKHGRHRFQRAQPCRLLWQNPRSATTNARFSNSKYMLACYLTSLLSKRIEPLSCENKQHGEPMESCVIHCHLLSLNKVVHKEGRQCYYSCRCFRAGWNSPLAVNRLRAQGSQAFGI